MLKNIKKTLANIFRIFDITIIIISFYISHFLRFGSHEFNLSNINQEFTIFFVSYVIIWFFFSHRFGLYVSKRHTSFKNELFNVLKSVGLTFAFAEIPAFFIRDFPLSRLFLIYFIPIQTSLLILFRFLLRLALKNIRRRGYNYRQILIAGRNRRAAKIAQKIRETPEFGLVFWDL